MSAAVRVRRAFTLIELLVVMVIIATLLGLLIPGINAAREASRGSASRNNLRQIGVAFNVHEGALSYYPSSWLPSQSQTGTTTDGWSVHVQLLPYLEQKAIYTEIDLKRHYNDYVNDDSLRVEAADGTLTKLSAMRVPTFISPAEPRDENREGKHYPVNYAVNLGTGFVWDPAVRTGGDGAAYPESRLKSSAFADGLGTTMCMAEVKAWQPYYRNKGLAATNLTTLQAFDAGARTNETAAAQVCTWAGASASEFKNNSGHTEWVDGRAHQIGFTSIFRPNAKIKCTESGVTYDVDWTNWQEGKDLRATTPVMTPTFAAVTARSYFPGVVNVVFMDGSVRAIQDAIDLGVWRAISSRAGNEKMPESFGK
jgi:prepilin-type N-terminal cleavage/methylation domain-containing protein